MAEVKGKSRIAVIGGGLVGALAACFLAKRGHRVVIYEYRSDIRLENSLGQSINLALSVRGREALRAIGLEDALVKCHGSRMRGRMLHDKNGNLKEIFYDSVKGNCIYSVSRRHLNVVLLDDRVRVSSVRKSSLPCLISNDNALCVKPQEFTCLILPAFFIRSYVANMISAAEEYPEVQLNFNRKLVDADLEKGRMKFLNMETGAIEDVETDLIIGADGAYSRVRKIMAKRPLFNYAQTYIEHGYVEISVPSGKKNEFAMNGNNLHIWPRGEFMMTSLPNEDRTFTGNLFAPFSVFEKLKTPKMLLTFYAEHFPDLLRLIGKQNLIKQFFAQEPRTLISVKCKPYHVGKTALIVGDAAHAMVPFYAQGMNAGFEDILLLDELMERYNSDFAKVLPKFSELRCDDGHAICDLAMYNYLEMRDLVTKKSFLVRKFLDNFLYTYIPNCWVPLYSSVHFTRMSFRDCIAHREWQNKVLRTSVWSFGALILAILIILFI
ncbi:kynurenine 3-monooxygenase isoform X1 [Linepithema humile]|uniref:kynurenine 3-monooxygenase isoform X1 n=1 Tax=Linepithema humile TaxID=83485 RepID=UPI00351E984F